MKSFYRIFGYIKKYKALAIFNVVFNILTIIFSLFSLVMLIPFLKLLFEHDIASEGVPPLPVSFQITKLNDYLMDIFSHHFVRLIIEHGQMQVLVYVCIMVVIIFFFKNLFRYLALLMMAPIRNGVVRDIRKQMYSKILSLPLSYYSSEKKGNVMSRMTSDVQEIEYGVMSTLEVLFREPLTILMFLGTMLLFSVKFTLFVLIMILVIAVVVGGIGKTLKRTSKKGQEKLGELVSIIEESLGGLRIIKAFNAEAYQETKFYRENRSVFRLMTRIQRRKDLSSPLSEFLAIIILSVVLWFGGGLVLKEGMEAATFIAFMAIFSQLIPPAKNFSKAFYNIQKGLASSDRVQELLDADLKVYEKANARSINSFDEAIQYENVSFAYYNYDDKKVVENINITIKKGRMVAIVGQSGAGKSTLVDLLPRFYDVVDGSIKVDGTDIRDFKIKDLRSQMGVVSQEAILFNDTVYNNIAFGSENITREAVENAAKVANAHDFIMNLEHGYDTIIGDRGNQLSGGERQRLTIARAVLNDPPILILDEATSSLDTKSEKLVQEAINKLMKNRTSIVIAHRLSTIQYADEIIVMQEGRIIERGNHIGLLAKNGTYKKLVDLQAF